MRVRFTKMHGAGNDFVLIDDRDGAFPCQREVLAKIGARQMGVGCEGIILVQESDRADFRMRFFNPDGSEAELCGNGARCVAAFAREIGAAKSDAMRFETLAGDVGAEIAGAGLVKIAARRVADAGMWREIKSTFKTMPPIMRYGKSFGWSVQRVIVPMF